MLAILFLGIFEYGIVDLIGSLFASGGAILGLFIGYHTYRSFKRYDDTSILWLGIGIVILTLGTYTVAVIGLLLIGLNYLTLPQQDIFWLLIIMLQFIGLLCIAYALHRKTVKWAD